jgi:hypothetical protein
VCRRYLVGTLLLRVIVPVINELLRIMKDLESSFVFSFGEEGYSYHVSIFGLRSPHLTDPSPTVSRLCNLLKEEVSFLQIGFRDSCISHRANWIAC